MSRHSSLSPKRTTSYDEVEANACREFEYKPVEGQVAQSCKIVGQSCEVSQWARASSPTESEEYCFVLTGEDLISFAGDERGSDSRDHAFPGVTSTELVERWRTIQNDWEVWPGSLDESRQSVVLSTEQTSDYQDDQDASSLAESFADAVSFVDMTSLRTGVALPPMTQPTSADQHVKTDRRDSQIPQELQATFLGESGDRVRRIATMTPTGMKYLPQKHFEQDNDLPQLRSSRLRTKINRESEWQ
jgi:hypothetical protein